MIINKIPSEPQKKAIKFCYERNRAIVCYATGSGKTLIMLILSTIQLEKDKVDGVIIVGTNSALKSISAEYKDTFNKEPLTEKEFKDGKKGIVLVAYQNLERFLVNFPAGKRYTLILDEYHKVKSSKTATTKLSNKLKARCTNRYGFSATLITKEFRDLYELVKWMNPQVFGSWEKFCQDYTLYYKMSTAYGFDILKPYKFRNIEKLKRVLESLLITYFPNYDIRYHKYECKLEDIKGYRNVIKEALEPTGDENKDKALYMQAVRVAKTFVSLSNEKFKALEKALKPIYKSHGAIVYCDEYATLNPVYDFLSKNLGLEVLKYTGKQAKNLNDKSMESFVQNPKGKVLLISRVAKESLNLQATNQLIVFDMLSYVGAVQQLMGRVAREYSNYDHYDIHFLITMGSVESYQYDYVTMYAEPLKRLFNNGLVPVGIPNYNEFLKKKLIKDAIWNR